MRVFSPMSTTRTSAGSGPCAKTFWASACPRGHADAQNVFAQGPDPALVLVVDIGLKTRIEHLADRLDHRIGHGDMQVAATAIQLDMEGGDDYHLAGADDIGQGRVHLRVDVLEVDIHHRVPGFAQVDKGLIQHHAHHAQLGGSELAPSCAWRPSPPKKLSTSLNTSLASRINRPVTRSGFIFTRFRLVGTYSECTYSPNFITCTPPTATSAERR